MSGTPKVILTLVLVGLYAYLIPKVGFMTMTGVFLLLHMWFLGIRRPVPLFGVAAGTLLVLFLVFQVFLGVPLPRGVFV